MKFSPFERQRHSGSTQSSAFHIGELCGYFSVAHSKNVDAAQVPWLAVTHLAVNPSHNDATLAHDDFLGLEPCVGITREPSAPELDHGGLSFDSASIRRGRRVLEQGVIGH